MFLTRSVFLENLSKFFCKALVIINNLITISISISINKYHVYDDDDDDDHDGDDYDVNIDGHMTRYM